MNSTTFLRQKSTGVKFADIYGDRSRLVPVSELHLHPELCRLAVKCDTCDAWHPAGDMTPTATGRACSSCARSSGRPTAQEARAAAMEKAAKLLRLAKSDNPNEAALAMARAQEIIDRHNLDAATLGQEDAAPGEPEPAEDIRDFQADPLADDGVAQTWKTFLAAHLADCNQCKAYSCAGAVCLIGRPSDVATVRAFFDYLVAAVDRLAARDCRGHGRTYANNYRLGAVETIGRRLRESRAATVAAVKAEALANGRPGALVVIENALASVEQRRRDVELWTARNVRLRKRARRSSYDGQARERGRLAGESVNLGGRSAGALGSGTKALQ